MAEETKLVAAASKGYNYNYTSLADLVRQDIKLPPMRVATLTDGAGTPVIVEGQPVEYIEAKIGEDWIRGARIIVPKGKQTNATQDYGAALTYARRYTALTVLGIACDSDDKIEKKKSGKEATDEFDEASRYAELEALWNELGGHEGFEDYFERNTASGFNMKTYAAIKGKLLELKKKKAQEGK